MEDTGERLIPAKNKDSVVYGEHMSRYLAVIDVVKGKKVLDVASGTGYGSQLLAGYAKSVTGVDYSPEAIEYSKKHYPAKNLDYLVGNAEELVQIGDNSFDVVVSMETIEHLNHPEKFVQQVKRVLKDNGIFVVSTPNDDEYREGNDFHLHEFTFPELKELMKKYFKKTNYYYQGNALAATLFSEEEFEEEFRKEMLIEKTISISTEKAIYFIAVASNNVKPPELTSGIAVSQHWNTKGFIEWDQEREATISNQIDNIESLKKHLVTVEQENSKLKNDLESLKDSSWHRFINKIIKGMKAIRRPRTAITVIKKQINK